MGTTITGTTTAAFDVSSSSPSYSHSTLCSGSLVFLYISAAKNFVNLFSEDFLSENCLQTCNCIALHCCLNTQSNSAMKARQDTSWKSPYTYSVCIQYTPW